VTGREGHEDLAVDRGDDRPLGGRDGDARAKCDGRRELMAPAGSSITAVKGSHPVLLARLDDVPFSGRLVDKFKLPVHGWRE